MLERSIVVRILNFDGTRHLLKYCGVFFSPHDAKIPFSLSNHLADVYLEELNKVLSESKEVACISNAAPLCV